VTENQGSIPENRLENRPIHPRKAAGAQITPWQFAEVVTRNKNEERFAFFNLNERNLKTSTRINWRASLVPAAAVIPAPGANIEVAVITKLVAQFPVVLDRPFGLCHCLDVLTQPSFLGC
jgi:hypothetical protein